MYDINRNAKIATDKQENELNNKPSRLSKEQVIWLNCLLLALFVGRLGLGGYTFANEQLERFSEVILLVLFVILAAVVFMAPKSIVRTISLVLTVPIAMLASLGACVGVANFDDHPDRVELVGKAGDVTFELVQAYEVTYYEICKQWIELRMQRPVLNGILKQQETLIIIHPAFSATAELIDSGRNIRISSPALLGRKAIMRSYSTDWDKARKNGLEHIQLTPAEQKVTGVFNSSSTNQVSSAVK